MSTELTALLLLCLFILVLLMIRFVMFIRSFVEKLTYINYELKRSSPSERDRWKRAKRRHWLSLIPFYRPKRKSHR